MDDEYLDVERLPEKGSIYAKVDQLQSVQDYPPFGNCMRLIGVTPASFEGRWFNDSCWTFLVDLGWRDIANPDIGWRMSLRSGLCGFDLIDWEAELPNEWIRIEYSLTPEPTGSYAYALFADQEPQYLSIHKVESFDGPVVAPLASAPQEFAATSRSQIGATLTAFHVGQGMCSLMTDGTTGYLIDAGAGTPVRRADYRKGKILNELSGAFHASGASSAIISHPDSDHWRLLDWDRSLLRAVQAVYLPDGVPALAFRSPAVKPKVVPMKDATFNLQGGSLRIFRSEPCKPDRNGECLVAAAVIDGRMALLPGDYVYNRMLNDRRPDRVIQCLASRDLDAVVVPHHGDSESALAVVSPLRPDRSIAFFSAGTHSGYKHPTLVSLDNHQRRGFAIVDRHWMRDIKGRRLLP
jgi:beta-lactamase superfamily II metal-dependent hydrolase